MEPITQKINSKNSEQEIKIDLELSNDIHQELDVINSEENEDSCKVLIDHQNQENQENQIAETNFDSSFLKNFSKEFWPFTRV